MRYGVLFVSPSSDDARLLSQILHPMCIPLVHATSLDQARSRLERESFGVILTEAMLPDGTWRDLLSLCEAGASNCSVVVTDPLADARLWADVLESGAYDLVCQPFCSSEVQRIVSNALTAPAEVRTRSHAAL